jgi:predicted glycoside hydrolase/deacetylase ChbG (UPF0249 family)
MTKTAQSVRDRKIIINADDFGSSSPVNYAIVQAFERRLISSATIMVNMSGFEEACELARSHGLVGRIGLHLNLTAGRPLTSALAACTRFCDSDGCLRPRQRVFYLYRQEIRALEAEIAAQIDACKRKGITPTHLDSHHHIHTEWGVSSVVIRAARRYGIPAVRMAINCGACCKGVSRLHYYLAQAYWTLHNSRLRFYGLARTRYFGSVLNTSRVVERTTADIEIMVHPLLNDCGQLVDLDGHDLETRIRALGFPAKVLDSYGELLKTIKREKC